ncbi:calmodulin [Trifolium repens]|nr:calmodulin [Trifolium repens]
MSHKLTKDQIAEFWGAFSLIDKDSDGFITVDELIIIIKSLEGNITQEEIQEMINKGDIDGNGRVDFEQFLHIIEIKMKDYLTEELKDSFKVFDSNNDGYISATELSHVMVKLGERLTDEEVEQMIREADLDGDGRTTTKSANQRLPLNKTVVVSLFIHLVGYCLENDTVAGSWCALVRAQQAAGSRQRAGEPS